MSNEPGLISRSIVGFKTIGGAEYAIIREVWNTKTPGCPMFVMKPGTIERNPEVASVSRTLQIPL